MREEAEAEPRQLFHALTGGEYDIHLITAANSSGVCIGFQAQREFEIHTFRKVARKAHARRDSWE